MKETNIWLDVAHYIPLMAPQPAAATQAQIMDDKTNLYVPPSINISFTIPQLYTTLYATGPLITEFPVSVQVLIDVGCHCTVISSELCDQLGLRQYPLP
jgi:hypothetical protein